MNKNYMKYLIRSWRIPVIFFAALFFGLAATPLINTRGMLDAYSSALTIMSVEAAALTVVLPVLLFSFAHRRRSADLYFALPVSRSQQLITNLLFAFCTVYGFFLITSLLLWIPAGNQIFPFVRVLAVNGTAILTIASLLLVYSFLYLIANNIFDGIVMMAAWSFLPLLVYIVIASFTDSMVAGHNTDALGDICMWLSPLVMGVRNLIVLSSLDQADPKLYFDILIALWGVIGACGLYYHFVKRRSERAEQLSDDPLAYPFIINVYALGILVILACALVYDPSMHYLTMYLLLLFIYVVAQFVYNRKIVLTKKIFMTFGALTLISLIFAQAAFRTRAFGIANSFPLDKDTNLRIIYNSTVNANNLSEEIRYTDSGMVNPGIQEAYISFTINMPVKEYESNAVLKEMMEKYREDGIAFFYSEERDRIAPSHMSFMNCSSSYYSYTNFHNYALSKAVSLEDLQYIDRLPYCTVTVMDNEYANEYRLSEWLAKKGN